MGVTRRRVALLMVLAGALLVLAVRSQSAPAVRAATPRVVASRLAGNAASSPRTQTRYSLVHGCYVVRAGDAYSTQSPLHVAGSDEPYRLQATGLGQYLIYGSRHSFLASGLRSAGVPGPSAVWMVLGSGAHGFHMINAGTGESRPVSFTPASGCAVYPEGGVDATGRPFHGASTEQAVSGTVDAHTHVTAFEFLGGAFHCGKPWDAYGIPYALPDCKPYEQGSNGVVESFLDYGSPSHPHDTQGWPTFRAWPSPTDLAEEGDYYTGIKRAWMAGLRIMVTHLVDNEALCQLMTTRRNPCNDMQAVHIQARALRALQDYIDAQSGGPGKGFFRIVTDPFQARRVINQGKLAVQEGIEVSHLFNCGEYLGTPQCSQAQIDAGMREVQRLGVSTFFPVHKFDNAFGGTKMDSGELGLLVNGGNHLETGHFWDVKTCTGPAHDSTQLDPTAIAPAAAGLTQVLNRVGPTLLPGAIKPPVPVPGASSPPSPLSALPVYPPPPHCNQRGLTSLGSYLLARMMQAHMIVQLDHMDVKTADAALSVLEAHHYSGVVSAHSWDSAAQENPRIYKLGGFVTPIAGASPQSFIDQWRASLTMRDKRFYNATGFGYGADMNGLAEESEPSSATPIRYPFSSYDGKVSFTREVWGRRTFDLNRDGVANYGMYADWLAELRLLAGRPILTDMFHGAEAYLQMWERAWGVAPTRCLAPRGSLSRAGAGRLRLGDDFRTLLIAAGQPAARPGASYRYCVAGRAGTPVEAVFGRSGRVSMVLSRVRGYRAGALRVGSSARALRAVARRGSSGVWTSLRTLNGHARYVYGVRGGRVWFVAVVSRSQLAHGGLAGALRAAGV
jgi:hypothetical protein